MEANNMAAMREALKLCGLQMCKFCKELELARSMLNKRTLGVFCHPDKCKAFQAVHAALAKSPRNCDVGTEEEQEERYEKFCSAHWGSNDMSGNNCKMCPLSPFSCRLAWAQMPYEKGEADGSKEIEEETK